MPPVATPNIFSDPQEDEFDASLVLPCRQFFDEVAPPLRPEFTVAKVIARLQRQKRKAFTKEDRLWGFSVLPSKSAVAMEDRYKHLKTFADTLKRACEGLAEPTFQFELKKDWAAKGGDARGLPDAYFVLREPFADAPRPHSVSVFGVLNTVPDGKLVRSLPFFSAQQRG